MQRGNIYLIESKNRQELAETFMRFQEYYESPVFRDRFFSAQEFLDWYLKEFKSHNYALDWSGFNIPSYVLEPFKTGKFDPLNEKEAKLVNILKDDKGDSYIIGVTPKDEECVDTLKHEFVHGAFFVNTDYRQEVFRFLGLQNPNSIHLALKKMGYGENVIEDEINAYMLTEPQTLSNSISLGDGLRFRDILDKIFQKYFKFSMITATAEVVLAQIPRIKI